MPSANCTTLLYCQWFELFVFNRSAQTLALHSNYTTPSHRLKKLTLATINASRLFYALIKLKHEATPEYE